MSCIVFVEVVLVFGTAGILALSAQGNSKKASFAARHNLIARSGRQHSVLGLTCACHIATLQHLSAYPIVRLWVWQALSSMDVAWSQCCV